MRTAVRFGIFLVLQMGLRKSNNMNKICHWPSTGLASKASLLDTEAHVLSVLAGLPYGLLVQE